MLGASFDSPEDNKAFAETERFGFRLLSDPDRSVGARYGAVRDLSDQHADFARRIAYLIDPEGLVRKVYDVTDVEGFAGQVLDDLRSVKEA